jgi:DNA polymerase III delta subunit
MRGKMKKYVLTDNLWELKRYMSKFEKRWLVEIEPSDSMKLSKLENFLFSYNMMEKPVVLVKSVEKWGKEDLKWLVEAVKETEADVVISACKPEVLKKFGKIDDLSTPKPWESEKWIEKIKNVASYYSVDVNDEVAKEIFARVGTDVDMIAKEMEKLNVVSDHPSVEDVKEMVPLYAKADLFEFVYLVLSKNVLALQMMKKLLSDTHPLVILRNLENTATLLAQLLLMKKREYSWNEIKEVSKQLGVRTPQIADLVGFSLGKKKRKNLLKIIELGELIRFLEETQDVEVEIKNGGESNFLLLNLIREWIQSGKGGI